MELEIQKLLVDNPKMYEHLKENSYYIKYLNRDPLYYKEFIERMKELYHERATDKISDAIDNMDIISNVLMAFK